MDLTEHVKEFRALQKSRKIRVADFCREYMLDYYEMVEALKRDKLRTEEYTECKSGDLELTDMPLTSPDPTLTTFVQDVHIKTPSNLNIHIHGITAPDLITVVGHLMTLKPC